MLNILCKEIWCEYVNKRCNKLFKVKKKMLERGIIVRGFMLWWINDNVIEWWEDLLENVMDKDNI